MQLFPACEWVKDALVLYQLCPKLHLCVSVCVHHCESTQPAPTTNGDGDGALEPFCNIIFPPSVGRCLVGTTSQRTKHEARAITNIDNLLIHML